MAVKIAVRLAISKGLLLRLQFRRPKNDWGHVLPRSENVNCARVDTGFEESLKEANDTELDICLACGRAHRQAGPDEKCEWEPESRWYFLNDDSVRYLAKATPDEKVRKGVLCVFKAASTHPATNMESRMLYSFPLRFRDSFKPETLSKCKNLARHNSQRRSYVGICKGRAVSSYC